MHKNCGEEHNTTVNDRCQDVHARVLWGLDIRFFKFMLCVLSIQVQDLETHVFLVHLISLILLDSYIFILLYSFAHVEAT
jgi:hypothetical protein